MTRSARLKLRRRGRDRCRRIFFEQLEDRSLLAATITVNSTLDTDARDSVLTLREAILINNRSLAATSLTVAEQAQLIGMPTSSDTDAIAFNTPGSGVRSIRITTELPTVTDSVVIDGYTQPGSSQNTNVVPGGLNAVLLIELDGSGTGGANGLVISGGGSTIRGLVIAGFSGLNGNGIVLQSNNNAIEGNFLGTDSSGKLNRGNFGAGVVISSTSGNRIGGATPAARNLISANLNQGVLLSSASNNLVQGNLIGT